VDKFTIFLCLHASIRAATINKLTHLFVDEMWRDFRVYNCIVII